MFGLLICVCSKITTLFGTSGSIRKILPCGRASRPNSGDLGCSWKSWWSQPCDEPKLRESLSVAPPGEQRADQEQIDGVGADTGGERGRIRAEMVIERTRKPAAYGHA